MNGDSMPTISPKRGRIYEAVLARSLRRDRLTTLLRPNAQVGTSRWRQPPIVTESNQDYLDKSDPFQPLIYVAKNTHATYFRAGSFIAHLGIANTQSQYSIPPSGTSLATDRANGLGTIYTATSTDLVALKQPAVLNTWRGLWGEMKDPDIRVIPPNVPLSGPPSPSFRGPVEKGGVGIQTAGPKEFHNAYLKITQGLYQIQ